MSNALKFTERGEVSLHVSVDHTEDGRSWLRFAVQDTGIGLSPATRERLFQPFVQADSSMARKHGGSGLGLAICRRLIQLMGGTITVASVEGAGSTFTCMIPFTSSTGALPASHPARAHATSLPVPVNQVARILVVEDNLVNQRITCVQLEKLGYRVEVAGNGQAAVQLLAASQDNTAWELVLMDCQMPEMDGFEATAIIRAGEQQTGRHLPIVALTANALPGDRERCIQAGMDDYLTKPIKFDELRTTVQRWLATPTTAPLRPAVQHQPPEPTPLDPAILAELRGLQAAGEPDLLCSLIDLFMDEAPSLLAAVRSAIMARDPAALRTAAHALKGCSSNLGATLLAAQCKILEDHGRAGTLAAAPAALTALETEYTRAVTALNHERATILA